jgi:hypothetical protein
VRLKRLPTTKTAIGYLPSGSSTRKVEPWSTSLDTEIRPPCASTMVRVM